MKSVDVTRKSRFQREAEEWMARSREAEARVGRTALDRLRWLISFSNRSPEEFQPASGANLLDLEEDAFYFASRGWHFPERGHSVWRDQKNRIVKKTEHKLTAKDMRELAKQIDSAIRELLAGRSAHFSVEPARQRIWRAISPSFAQTWGGDWRVMFLMSAFDVLAAEGRRIAKCARGSCAKVFVRRKRGAYCSRACSQRERTRRYREKNRARLSERRHELYAQRVQKLKGKSRKVGRRTKEQ
jgi:hypothetical protein